MNKPLIPIRAGRRAVTPQLRGRSNCHLLDSCQRLITFCTLISIIFGMTYLPSLYMRHLKPVAFVWPANQTRDAYEMIFPNVSTSLVPSLCAPTSNSDAKSSSAAVLVVVICSAVKNFEARRAIRTTWAQKDLVPPGVRIVFLLGRSQNFTGQGSVMREAKEYGDIVQENFIDSYANLTIKSLMMLKWYTQNCDNVPYLLKTDDDMYINLKNLHKILLANRKPNLLLGNLICGAKPIRDPYNKWYAPEYLYDSEYYPNYLSGTAYVLSRSTAKIFLEAAGSVPMLHMEDIYITGCLARFVGIRPEDHRGFSYEKRAVLPCLYSQVISSHQVSPAEMKLVASKLSRPLHCRALKPAQLRSYGTGKCKWTR